MGSRANAVVVNGGNRHVYYSHGAAQTLDALAFYGPEFLLEEVQGWRDGRESNPDWDGEWWLDNAFAEGGCCIDLDNKYLLLYGGDDAECDVLWLETYLKLLRYAWRGWTVEWSWGELGQIARYAGITGEKLEEIDWKYVERPEGQFLNEYVDAQLGISRSLPYASSTLSTTKRGLTKVAFTFESMPEKWLYIGDRIEKAFPSLGDAPSRYEDKDFLMGSIHFDFDSREIWLWRTWDTYVDVELSGFWNEWKLHDCRYDYRSFYRKVPRIVDFAGTSEADYVKRIASYVAGFASGGSVEDARYKKERILSDVLAQYRNENPDPPLLPVI